MSREYLTTSATLAGPTKITTTGVKITTARLNLRSAPDPKRGVIGTLAEGTRLRLTGKTAHGFAETRHTGKSGRWTVQRPSSWPCRSSTPSATFRCAGSRRNRGRSCRKPQPGALGQHADHSPLGVRRRAEVEPRVVILTPVVVIFVGPASVAEVVRYSRDMYASPPAKWTRTQVPRTGWYARIR